ncbi:MAG: PAS domain S-box protein [Desulfobacterales bacterium]|nr:PAS domain S-box protein [Desulfobacterales bacterium]
MTHKPLHETLEQKIKKLKETLTTLQQSEKKYRELVQNIGTIILHTDIKGHIKFLNKFGQNFLGYDENDVIGKNMFDIIISEKDDTLTELNGLAENRTFYSDKLITSENETICGNGNRIRLSWTHKAVCDAEGNIVGFVSTGNDISKYKHMEDELKLSNKQLADIINYFPDATLAINSKGEIIAWNWEIEKLTGIKAEDMLGKGNYEYSIPFYGKRRPMIIDLFFKSDPDLEKTYTFVHKDRDSLIAETKFQRHNGKILYFWAKANPIYNNRGDIVGAIESIREMTKHRMAENKIREGEERYRAIFDGSRDAIFITGENAEFFDINAAASELSGYSKKEMMNFSIFDLLNTMNLKSYENFFHRIMADESIRFEAQIIKKDGTKIDTEFSNKKVIIDGAACVHMVARDITDRKKTERSLWQSEQRYRKLVDTMTDGLIFRGKCGQITFVNDRFCEILGRSQDEIISRFMSDFLDDSNRSILGKQIIERRKGSHDPYELTWINKNGQKITTIMAPKSVFDENGYFEGSFAVVTDITERKRAEEILSQQAKELSRSNSELEQFAYAASHDLQEPLRKIVAFGERLNIKCGDVLGDQGHDYLKRMSNAAKRMQILISDLLAFSRVTTRAQPFSPVNLNQVVQENLQDLEVLIDKTQGTVEIESLPTIEADPTQMRQLIQNLIENALKFHREDVAPIVKIRGQILADKVCQIMVEDNGIGFNEKYERRIFEVFQRLHGRGVYEGTGIGLAICRKIVERHGGNINAKSVSGQGTTFIVTLPVKQAERLTNRKT